QSTVGTRYSVDISQLVQAWINGGIANNGVMLEQVGDTTATNGNILSFGTNESTTQSQRPTLTITYSTQPSCVPGVPTALSQDQSGTTAVLHAAMNVTGGCTGHVAYTISDGSGTILTQNTPGVDTLN